MSENALPMKRRFSESNIPDRCLWPLGDEKVQLPHGRNHEPYKVQLSQETLNTIMSTLDRERGRQIAAKFRHHRHSYLEKLELEMNTQIRKYEDELRYWERVLSRTEDPHVRARCEDLFLHHAKLINNVDWIAACDRQEHEEMEDVHYDQNVDNGVAIAALDQLFVSSGLLAVDDFRPEISDDGPPPINLSLLDGPVYKNLSMLQHGPPPSDASSACSPAPMQERPLLWPEESWHSAEGTMERETRLLEKVCGPLDQSASRTCYSAYENSCYDLFNMVRDSEPMPSPTDQEIIVCFDKERLMPWLDMVESGIAPQVSMPELDDWSCREIELGEDELIAANHHIFVAEGRNRELIDDWTRQCKRNAPVREFQSTGISYLEAAKKILRRFVPTVEPL
ncbi:MAG: hypothetical protein M1828_005816 [Chrysothrix sp. TS-e1954]|nr:MAG: hypothetical protein M1828_005816 [Chrysothrix sp. TS-e1954]